MYGSAFPSEMNCEGGGRKREKGVREKEKREWERRRNPGYKGEYVGWREENE